MSREPVPGKPYPSRWPLRVKPKGARAVHAGRESDFLGQREVWTACGAWYLSAERAKRTGRMRSRRTKVTCQGCLKRLARPLTPAEAWLFANSHASENPDEGVPLSYTEDR